MITELDRLGARWTADGDEKEKGRMVGHQMYAQAENYPEAE
jgi:hypothetical protein